MRIDYSLPEDSSSYCYLDASFRYGYRHFYNLGSAIMLERSLNIELLSFKEKVQELVLGIFEMLIPVVGHLVAYVEKRMCDRGIRVIHLKERDPFEMGKEQGTLLKDDIQFLIQKGMKIYTALMVKEGLKPFDLALKLEELIPKEYQQEMRGLAEGSGVSYAEILTANTLLDSMNIFGCSLYALSDDTKNEATSRHREIATNFFDSPADGQVDVDQSFARYQTLLAWPHCTDTMSMKNALRFVDYYDTIQSIIFDTTTCDTEIATAGGYAASRSFTSIQGKELFPHKLPNGTSQKVVKLARNLDWPMPMLGPETCILVRPALKKRQATAIIGWPGLLGALSGINEQGTSLGVTVVPSQKQAGTPNQFIMRKILETAETVDQATRTVARFKPSSGMNVVVAAPDGIVRMELDPARAKKGAAHTRFGMDENIEPAACLFPHMEGKVE